MSTTNDDIPFDIQTEIIKRIPDVKSLIRFRSVSKSWKSLIDSSKFISAYKSSNHRLLVTHYEPSNRGYISVDDNDSFTQHNFPLPNSPGGLLVGISQGLLCFYNGLYEPKHPNKCEIVIWNPSIRKSVTFDAPEHSYDKFNVFGFGVCRRTCDPKLLYLEYYHNRSISAKIFTLSYGDWRNLSVNLPNNISNNNTSFCWTLDDSDHKAVIDGILYLHATTCRKENECDRYNRIITFDFTSEEFGEICLPDKLANGYLSISKLNESLVVLVYNYRPYESQVCNVWIMDHGATKLLKKQFTINTPFLYNIIGFRMNGQAIIETKEIKKSILQVYDLCTRRIRDHVLSIHHYLHFKYSYTKSLVLLNQPNSIIH